MITKNISKGGRGRKKQVSEYYKKIKSSNNVLLAGANPNTGKAQNYLDNMLSFRSKYGNIKYVDNEIDNITNLLF